MTRRPHLTVALLLAALAVAGCSQLPVPVLPELERAADKVPVVLVPGITGSGLRDPESGKLVWGNGAAVLRPRDRGYALAQPIEPGAVRRGGPLELTGVIEAVRLGPIKKEVYGPIVRLMERNGYRLGDLDSPRPEDSFFLFAYDWRQENVASAARLAAQLESLRRARGGGRLLVDLVCQSNGAHVCRWFTKYGGASLEEAEAGGGGPPQGLRVRKLILVSSSNGGSLRNLSWLQRGRRYVTLVGRRWSPEALFTIRAVYEDLPVFRDDLFLDAAGELLDVDLFDLESWRRYGWSVLSPRVDRRIERSGRTDLFADREAREAFLGRALDRARRFHDLLRRDVDGFDGVRYYLIQNVTDETPLRAVLTRRGEGWRIRFVGDRWLERRPELATLAIAPGDGHATVESQLWLAPQERLAMASQPAQIVGEHFELILAPAAKRQLLVYLHQGDGAAAMAAGSE